MVRGSPAAAVTGLPSTVALAAKRLALRRHARRGHGKANADDQRHADECQHHRLEVGKAVGGKQRKVIHDTLPKDVPSH